MAELLVAQGYRVFGIVRPEASRPFKRLQHIEDRIELVESSLLDQLRLQKIIESVRPTEIYNFGARASSAQLYADPLLTSEYNGIAVVRLMDAILRTDPSIRFCQASSSEIFGNADQFPQNETTVFRPRNPYGIAKLFAHSMVGSFRENHGLFACSSILFNHESPRRGHEFVTRKITRAVARIAAGLETSLHLGTLDATRDWGYAVDYVRAMWLMLQASNPDDYVLATGISHSVEQFCEIAFRHAGLNHKHHVVQDSPAQRPRDLVKLVGDSRKARETLHWTHSVSFETLVCMMVDADIRSLATETAEPV